MESRPGHLFGKRIMVTGASGFLGSALVRRLVAEGAVVAAVSRTKGGLAPNYEQGFQFFPCDLEDASETGRLMVAFAPDILFHFAASPDGRESFTHAHDCIRSNTIVTLNALEGFRLAHGDLFIYGDSCKVYGNGIVPYREAMPVQPISSYAIAKAAGWQLCNLYTNIYKLGTLSIRPTMVYGPGQSYNLISYVVDCVLDGKTDVVLDGGSQTRDPLYIDDAVEAYVSAARFGHTLSARVVNIGGGQETTVRHLTELVLKIMNANLPVTESPARARPTEMWRSYCDNFESQSLLLWQACVSLREGLSRTIRYLVESRAHSRQVTPRARGIAAGQTVEG